jgi:pimeloyl-ACP methyl ester carboxylesterase
MEEGAQMDTGQDSAAWRAARRIDIGGRRLALRAMGRGQPAVVLEMGLGADGSFFDPIAQRMAAYTRVVWYDHAGLGRSDPAPTPRTIADLAADLHALLRAAQIPLPYVLAGHSLGGLTVRFYQHQYPAEVAALVLIESAHEAQRERLLAALPPESGDEPPAVARYRHALLVNWADPTDNDERIDNLANTALLRDCAPLGRLPLVVVSRGRADAPAGFPPALVADRERAWRRMQCDLAALSSQSTHLIAERSGHLVNRDQPELVVEGIRQAVELAREQEWSAHA